ncbi:MAG: tetratricopeptide repeat protein [Zoogloeaceae bacterium]|nr:tetratricopeptide repeat protein [Zoogloeaceae bacterium]
MTTEQEETPSSLLKRGDELAATGELEGALAVFEEIDRRFAATDPDTRKILGLARIRIVEASGEKGFALADKGLFAETIALCEEIARRFGHDDNPEVRKAVVGKRRETTQALYEKSRALQEMGRLDASIALYAQIAHCFATDDDPDVRGVVARALLHKDEAESARKTPVPPETKTPEIPPREDSPSSPEPEPSQEEDASPEPAPAQEDAPLPEPDLPQADSFREVRRPQALSKRAKRWLIAALCALPLCTLVYLYQVEQKLAGFLARGEALVLAGRIDEAESVYDEARRQTGRHARIDTSFVQTLVARGEMLKQQGKSEEAFAIYDKAIEGHEQQSDADIYQAVNEAMFGKADILLEKEEHKKALAVYDALEERYDDRARARELKGMILHREMDSIQQGVFDEAATFFENSEEKAGPTVQTIAATALFCKAHALRRQGEEMGAEAIYGEIERRFAGNDHHMVSLAQEQAREMKTPQGRNEKSSCDQERIEDCFCRDEGGNVKEGIAKTILFAGASIVNGPRHKMMERYLLEKAMKNFTEVDDYFNKEDNPRIRESVANALGLRSIARILLNENYSLSSYRIMDSIRDDEEVIRRYGKDTDPAVRQVVAQTRVIMSTYLTARGRQKEALAALEEVIREYEEDERPEIQEIVLRAFLEKATAQEKDGQLEEALATLDKIAQHYDRSLNPWAGQALANALFKKGEILGKQKQCKDAAAAYEMAINASRSNPLASDWRRKAKDALDALDTTCGTTRK